MKEQASKINDFLVNIDNISYNKKYSKIANLHKYWARKPWYIVEGFIEKYTNIKDVVLDPFCGSGIIGYEAVMKNRDFVGYDLNPLACFLSEATIKNHFNIDIFNKELEEIAKHAKDKISKMYETDIKCKKCGNFKFATTSYIGPSYKNKNEADVVCFYCGIAGTKEKKDVKTQTKIKIDNKLWYPRITFPNKFYKDRFSYKGIKEVKDFFTHRNLSALAILYDVIFNGEYKYKHLFKLAFSNTLLHVSILKAPNVRPLSVNNYWIPDDYIEENVWWRFIDRAEKVGLAKQAQNERKSSLDIKEYGNYKIYNKSSLKMKEVKDGSIDYLITDPPYGDAIQYSELSFIWNAWLSKEYKIDEEVIINPVQNKGHEEFIKQIKQFIEETHRVLKMNKFFTLCFQNKNIQIWTDIIDIIKSLNFELVDIKVFDTYGSPYNKHWAKFSPKSDLYITFKKVKATKNMKSTGTFYLEDVVSKIIEDSKGEKQFNISKGYDLFVAYTIERLFNGGDLVEHKKLQLKDVINTFEKIMKYGNIQKRIF